MKVSADPKDWVLLIQRISNAIRELILQDFHSSNKFYNQVFLKFQSALKIRHSQSVYVQLFIPWILPFCTSLLFSSKIHLRFRVPGWLSRLSMGLLISALVMSLSPTLGSTLAMKLTLKKEKIHFTFQKVDVRYKIFLKSLRQCEVVIIGSSQILFPQNTCYSFTKYLKILSMIQDRASIEFCPMVIFYNPCQIRISFLNFVTSQMASKRRLYNSASVCQQMLIQIS